MDLDNDRTWTDREGVERRLEEMTPEHRGNILAWLERHAGSLQRQELIDALSGPMPDEDSEAYSMVVGGIQEWASMTTTEWLNQQPVVQRLRQLEAADRITARRQPGYNDPAWVHRRHEQRERARHEMHAAHSVQRRELRKRQRAEREELERTFDCPIDYTLAEPSRQPKNARRPRPASWPASLRW